MIDALVMTLALSSVPDHLLPQTEKEVTIEVDEAVNYKKNLGRKRIAPKKKW